MATDKSNTGASRDYPMSVATGMREDGTPQSTYNDEYDYVLRYIAEAIDARAPLVEWTGRAIQAYQGYPLEDRYVGRYEAYAKSYIGEDNERYERLMEVCKQVRPRQNHTIEEAIDTMTSQALGGVARYEAEVYNPYFTLDPDIVDKLNAGAKCVWMDNHVDAMLPQMIEGAGLSGSSYIFIEKKEDSDRELNYTYIPATEMLIDPIRSKRNNPRYRGHQTKMSWAELKKHLLASEWTDEYKLRSINEVDTYLEEVEWWINKYEGNFSSIDQFCKDENLRQDLDRFFKASALAWVERNNKYIQHAGDQGHNDSRYRTDEVEVCYLFDYANDLQFTVVNRRFIVDVNHNYLSNYLDYTYPVVDPYSGSVEEDVGSIKIHLKDPYVALEYKRSFWMNYAYSPIINVLDTFDDICALESLIYHTIGLMTPITFTGNPTDIEKLSQIVGVSGEVIKGFIANSVTVLNKVVDLTPALTELQRLENRVKWLLNGPDAAAQMQMMHDRASGTEASMASGVVTQGLNSLIDNIEVFAAELAEKSFKMLLITHGDDWEYNFPMDFKTASLTRKELSSQIHFHTVLKNRMKTEARQNASLTMQWFVPLAQSEYIPNKEQMVKDVIPVIAEGFSQTQIQKWFEVSKDQQDLQDAQMAYLQAQTEAANRTGQKIDLSNVNPYGENNQFSTQDIASALGGKATPTGQTTEGPSAQQSSKSLDMTPSNPKPYTGGRAPSGTSRSLQYGITTKDEDIRIPIPALTPQEVANMGEDPLVPEYLSPEAEDLITVPDPLLGGDNLKARNMVTSNDTDLALGFNTEGNTYQENSNAAMNGDYTGLTGAATYNKPDQVSSDGYDVSYNPSSGGIAANQPWLNS